MRLVDLVVPREKTFQVIVWHRPLRLVVLLVVIAVVVVMDVDGDLF